MEKVQAWVIALSCLRRPIDWYGGKRKNIFLNETSTFKHSLSLTQLFQDTPVHIPTKLNPEMNLIDFINMVKIKAFPESCNRSLCFIANHYYPLIISDTIPTPAELLQIQISGKRIITFNENICNWGAQLFSGRDFLGFVMHDLIHADHFFFKTEHRDGQLGFFRFIQNILPDEGLGVLLLSEKFKTGFEYIISDMNSHPLHLFQTLMALLFSEVKDDIRSQQHWKNWIAQTRLTDEESSALGNINSPGFDNNSARIIEILCIRLGKQISI
ncbi:MAG: hypothetical protein AABY53_06870 [Bdellovibrionota bacterium]